MSGFEHHLGLENKSSIHFVFDALNLIYEVLEERVDC